jgi:hypothetical protein
VTELDIWRSAQQLLKEYDNMAEMEAAMRADAALADGNTDGVKLWQSILAAIKVLRSKGRKPGEPLN